MHEHGTRLPLLIAGLLTAALVAQAIAFADDVHRYPAHSARAVDGDTVRVSLRLGFDLEMVDVPLRINGIDTAELRGGTAELKAHARDARDCVNQWLESAGDELVAVIVGKGKYGRTLGDLEASGERLTDMLVAARLAVRYDGGSRAPLQDEHRRDARARRLAGVTGCETPNA
ncbi:MAG: thermonuclease family protein [Holophagales bacterium]|nr:thermonuclease family protein [Holophagales bacterium]